jgi:signal transducing adaptor molecule
MPEPTAVELGKEAEQEAAVFAQAVNVQKLLDMLRAFDPTSDNLADNEEIQVLKLLPIFLVSSDLILQELYRSSMALRTKIVKLIDKYSQKRGTDYVYLTFK